MPASIRDYRDDDLEALVAINDAASPAVPVTPPEEFAALVVAASTIAVVDDGEPAGFILVLPPGLDYASENYRWFSERSARFRYVDRIVVAERARDGGVGGRLYAKALADAAAEGAETMFCEVNLDPPNPASMRFHARLGFREVGRQRTTGGTKEVALLALPLAEADR